MVNLPHPSRPSSAAVALTALLPLAGCSGDGQGRAAERPAPPPARLTITPVHGTDDARPDRPITVQAAGGTIRQVTVSIENGNDGKAGKAGKVEGALNPARTRWTSRWTLAPDTDYQVTAIAAGPDGRTTTLTSAFSTLKPKETIRVSAAAPFDEETVGVGMPIILDFDRPVYNKAEVERALQVTASTPVEGAWRWVGRQQVVYRTKKYWPARTDVTVTARMRGVRAAKDVYGTRDLKLRFRVGDEQVSTASARTHTMTVKRNDKTVRRIPVSMGKATKRAYTTTNGVHLTMEKAYHVVMDSATVGIPKGHPDYYKLDVYYAVRISNSGEFTHSAPWSVGSQGTANVSHGCVNMSPKNAAWFYRFSRRGDIYKITGTDRELEWNNGWGYWQLSWNEWRKGSALD
ncbi:Lipoprotein-anchoring transpeptidase ErfK/SrfK [Thermomonospora echinospora]|uniref:Lipoprotein-anchoring transpeptidase ErfK/SrfK n=1 Tax=Thermomonospora echinospora TaxID=1992 RepID=A0A1H6BEB1_9ACTN|nr:Ig-like domain-containing protein [Thermomonospora echinospora]SEG58992.1 Lipoprotein-anchoring transpeptidase ErfK/SrfK [Thermomonospora echinospora]